MKCAWAAIRYIAIAALVSAMPAAARAQAAVPGGSVVLVSPTCGRCKVVVAPWGQLGGEGKEGDGSNFSALRVTSDFSVIAAVFGRNELWRMDRNGRVLARIGRKGEGPGEYRMPWRLWMDQFDSTYVLDRVLSRISVLSPSDKYVRAFRVPTATRQFLPLGGTRTAVTAMFLANQGVDDRIAALPLHILRSDTIVKSFGVPVRGVNTAEAYSPMDRFILPYEHSILVLPYTYHYSIEQWDTGGTLVRRYVREPDWFKPFDHFVGSYYEPPSPMIVGAWVDQNGHLWIVTKHAADSWRGAWSKTAVKTEGGGEAYSDMHPELLYKGTIEVVDLKAGTLLASTDIPFELQYVLGRGIVGQMKWDGPQGGNVVLYRVELRGQ